MAYIPRKGDIVRLNFDPVAGHEQAKQRPALVVSPQAVHETFGLCWVLPITTRVRGTAFEIPVTGGETNGVVLTQQIRTVEFRARGAEFIEAAGEQTREQALHAVRRILG